MSSRIRKNALKDPKYTLKDMLLDGRHSETSQFRQSGNDARMRTGGSKIEGWNTASHVVKLLI